MSLGEFDDDVKSFEISEPQSGLLGRFRHGMFHNSARSVKILSAMVIVLMIGFIGVLGWAIAAQVKVTQLTESSGIGVFPEAWNDVANDILSRIDNSTAPCDDFYQYACGGWIRMTPYPPNDQIEIDVFYEVEKQNAERLFSILEEDWPLVSDLFDSCSNDVTQRTIQLQRMIFNNSKSLMQMNSVTDLLGLLAVKHTEGVDLFFSLSSSRDLFVSPSQLYVSLEPSGLTVPPELYSDQSTMALLSSAVRERFSQSGVFVNSSQITNAVNAVLAVESALANATLQAEVQSEDWTKYAKIVAIPSLPSSSPLPQYFSNIFNAFSIQVPQQVLLIMPSYFDALNSIFQRASIDQMRYYFIWRMMFQFLSTNIPISARERLVGDDRVSDPLLELWRDYKAERAAMKHIMQLGQYRPQVRNQQTQMLKTKRSTMIYDTVERIAIKKLNQSKQTRPVNDDTRQCAQFVTDQMQDFVGHIFSEIIVTPVVSRDVRSIAQYIIDAYSSNLNQLNWIDESSRKAVTDKLNNIIQLIGHPNVKSRYRGLLMSDSSNDFAENFLALRFAQFGVLLASVGTPFNRENYEFPATIVNAFYSPLSNSINFPAGILESPMYSKSLPKLLNFARLGYIVGHEIGHSLDNNGRNFDKNGALNPFMDRSSSNNFDTQAQCISSLYSSLPPLAFGRYKVDGDRTLGENIADFGGSKYAYRAYKRYVNDHGDELKSQPLVKSLTNDQLFFVYLGQSWCTKATETAIRNQLLTDVHSPSKYRINAPLSNLPEFASAFQCAKGSKMNPSQQCSLW